MTNNMTNKEAINELAEMGNALQIIPSTRKGQALKMAILALSTDVRENIHGHIMETHFSDCDLFKCSECGRRFIMQKSYGIYKACPFCMAIFDNGVDTRGEE